MKNKTEFIAEVHRKIRMKKRQRVNLTTIAVSICVVVSLILYRDYSFSAPDEAWATLLNDSSQIEIYKWEYMEEMTDDELFLYLIDEQSEEEFLELADNSNEIISALKSITWEKK